MWYNKYDIYLYIIYEPGHVRPSRSSSRPWGQRYHIHIDWSWLNILVIAIIISLTKIIPWLIILFIRSIIRIIKIIQQSTSLSKSNLIIIRMIIRFQFEDLHHHDSPENIKSLTGRGIPCGAADVDVVTSSKMWQTRAISIAVLVERTILIILIRIRSLELSSSNFNSHSSCWHKCAEVTWTQSATETKSARWETLELGNLCRQTHREWTWWLAIPSVISLST